MLIISPYSKVLRNGEQNPKNYPWWPEVISGLNDLTIYQAGVGNEAVFTGVIPLFDKSICELEKQIRECDAWISVDNFFPHLAEYTNVRGVVIFGQSDPEIFGYKHNINLLKDRKYLRAKQFDIWEATEYNKECFIPPSEVIKNVRVILQQRVNL